MRCNWQFNPPKKKKKKRKKVTEPNKRTTVIRTGPKTQNLRNPWAGVQNPWLHLLHLLIQTLYRSSHLLLHFSAAELSLTNSSSAVTTIINNNNPLPCLFLKSQQNPHPQFSKISLSLSKHLTHGVASLLNDPLCASF